VTLATFAGASSRLEVLALAMGRVLEPELVLVLVLVLELEL